MLRHATLFVLAGFWLVMNGLLWRSEFSPNRAGTHSIPADVVWNKILTAPDDSVLEISRDGIKVGDLRWRPNIGDALATGKVASENADIEGMVKRTSGYTLDMEGSFLSETLARRIRFHGDLGFNPDRSWKSTQLNVSVRPMVWSLAAEAGARQIEVAFTDGDSETRRKFALSDLPGLLIGLGGLNTPLPELPGLAEGMAAGGTNNAPMVLEWKAYQDTLNLRGSRLRAYRLEARLFDRHKITVWITRVGEILKADLPGGHSVKNSSVWGI